MYLCLHHTVYLTESEYACSDSQNHTQSIGQNLNTEPFLSFEVDSNFPESIEVTIVTVKWLRCMMYPNQRVIHI